MNSQVLNLPVRLLFAMVLVVTVLPVAGAALPGCPTRCGNVAIPFPFGIRPNCSLDDSFIIICNNTYNPPKPFLNGSIEVVDISLDGYLKVPSFMAYSCHNDSRSTVSFYPPFSTQNFFISARRNMFTAVGCDTFASVEGIRSSNYSIVCLAICDRLQNTINGSCDGIGCCDMSIPLGLSDFKLTVNSYKNHTEVQKFSPCGFAFVAEEGYYNFSSADLRGLQYKTGASFPLVLEWLAGNLTCQEAQKNESAYACQSDYSECRDSYTGKGYNCACQAGFEGNPYIRNGCQDINECEISNPCDGICINRPGSFTCSCPNGYEEGVRCRRKNKGAALYVAIGAAAIVGVLFLVAASCMSYKLLNRRRDMKIKKKFFVRNGGLLLQKQLCAQDSIVEKTTTFTAAELEKATDNFNQNRILGHGGQGTVYKGMLTDGRIVAIKRSKLVDESQLEQFINEVVILSQVVHKNVVRLLGCCLETEVPLLVYEFIVNGTLYNLIHNDLDQLLTWNIRLRIATEVAGAFAYLHSAISIPIYHRDIKSSNILLDERYTAKVSDFGTSRSVGDDKTHVTTLVKGTFGYLDPEYFQSSQFTEKSDVYSFGVVLVELLTRQKAISSGSSEEGRNSSLATRFLVSMEQNCLSKILDAQILDDNNKGEIIIVAKLAEKCLNLNGKKRPTMKEVAMELERIRVSKTDPTIQANFLSLESTEEEPESDTSFTCTTTRSSVVSVSDDHPLLFSTV